MEQEVISVIVPVYNIEKYLPRCLECISGQSYHNLEIILVDDGSTDESGRICDDFVAQDVRAKVIHQQNMGLWAARNTGQEAATGDYLFFPDGDDYFHRDIIKLLYGAINKDTRYDLAIVRGKMTWKPDEEVSSNVDPCFFVNSCEDLISGLLGNSPVDSYYVYVWNKLYRRRLIQGMRSREFVRSQDFDFNLRVFMKVDKAILIDNELYYWFQHPGSLIKHPNSLIWMLACRSRILYQNYTVLPKNKAHYGHYLLSRLYKMMISWKARSVSDPNRQDVFQECRGYEHDIRKAYLSCKGISLFEKLACLLLFHYPGFTRFLMKVSKNY